jgi:hypothetical protein
MAEQAVGSSPAAQKIGIWNDVTSMNWSEFRPLAALACLPAIILLIAFGLALGNMTAALAASSGALVVGFGAFQQDFRDPVVPMFLVSVGMSISAGIGTLAHASLPLDLTCVALWGFGLGLMNIVGRGPGWLALQGSTALVIAAAFPATPVYAAWRLVLVLAGGAVQLIVVQAIRWLAPGHLFRPAANAPFTVRSILSQVRDLIAGRAPGLGHAVTMALAVSTGELVYRMLDNAERLLGADDGVADSSSGGARNRRARPRPAGRDSVRRWTADAAYGAVASGGPRARGSDRRRGVDLLRIPAGELCDFESGDHDVRGAAVRDRWAARTGGCAPQSRGDAAGRGYRTDRAYAGHLGHAALAPVQSASAAVKVHPSRVAD